MITEILLFSISAFVLGGLITWLILRHKIEKLLSELVGKSDKISRLENEYAALRVSSQEQILTLKEEKNSLILYPKDYASINKHKKLDVGHEKLLNKTNDSEGKRGPDQEINQEQEIDIIPSRQVKNSKSSNKELLKLVKKVKQLEEYKRKYKKSQKRNESLKNEIDHLKSELYQKKDKTTIEKRVEIRKSLRIKKLKQWLNKEKAYKVSKKVSTSRLNHNS